MVVLMYAKSCLNGAVQGWFNFSTRLVFPVPKP